MSRLAQEAATAKATVSAQLSLLRPRALLVRKNVLDHTEVWAVQATRADGTTANLAYGNRPEAAWKGSLRVLLRDGRATLLELGYFYAPA